MGRRWKKRIKKIARADVGAGWYHRDKEEEKNKKSNEAQAVAAAGETPEQQLQRMQLEDLIKQREEEDLFRPEYMRTQGYTLDPTTGQYRKMSNEEKLASMDTGERAAYDIQDLANQRTLKGMRGELEIDPGVEQDIAAEEERTRGELSAQLGTGYAVSTPGMKRLEEMKAKANALRSKLRHGEISMAENVGAGRRGELQTSADRYQSASDPYQRMGYQGNALSQYADERNRIIDRTVAAKEARRNRYSGLVGSALGAAGSYFGSKSSKDYKDNIKPVTEAEDLQMLDIVASTQLSRYNYKPEISAENGDGGKEHLGLIAEEAPEEVATFDRKAVDLYDMNSVLWAAIRALNKEVIQLRKLVAA